MNGIACDYYFKMLPRHGDFVNTINSHYFHNVVIIMIPTQVSPAGSNTTRTQVLAQYHPDITHRNPAITKSILPTSESLICGVYTQRVVHILRCGKFRSWNVLRRRRSTNACCQPWCARRLWRRQCHFCAGGCVPLCGTREDALSRRPLCRMSRRSAGTLHLECEAEYIMKLLSPFEKP